MAGRKKGKDGREGEERRERGREVYMGGGSEGGRDGCTEGGRKVRGLMRMEGERCQQQEICSYTFGQGSVRMVVIGLKEGAKFKHAAVL